ncbi:UPF0161 protein-like protein [Drosera capensis]
MATTAITFHFHTHRRPPIHCYLVTLSRPKPQSIVSTPTQHRRRYLSAIYLRSDKVPRNQVSPTANRIGERGEEAATEAEEEVNSVGVKAALSMLRFYKREISPLLPKSCRYVPSCSEYSMIAYKEYGVVKGTVGQDLIPLDGLTRIDHPRNDCCTSRRVSTAATILENLRTGTARFEFIPSASTFLGFPFSLSMCRNPRFFARIGASLEREEGAMKKVERFEMKRITGDGRCMFRALVIGMAANKGMSLTSHEERQDDVTPKESNELTSGEESRSCW